MSKPSNHSTLEDAIRARRDAMRRATHDPLRYAAYRYASSVESALSDSDHDCFMAWLKEQP